ncbi:phage holin [Viridibacillus sp. FSL H8-0110]|uniref:phage holin n=1 Tax=Viridibacillus sp. FSL H8-0110 TaxID=2921376 RepID=UPI0030F5A5E3
MIAEKLKQYIGLFGGWLGAVLLFLQALDIKLQHFNDVTIDAFVGVLMASIPFILVGYGVWKNSYVISKQAKDQEEVLKKKGLK